MDNSQISSKENFELGKQLIESAIKVDEALAELLKIEVRRMKKLVNSDSSSSFEEFSNVNILVKNIIIAIMTTEDKIKTGLNLCKEFEKNWIAATYSN